MFSPVMALKLARQVEELQENGEQVEQGWALKLGPNMTRYQRG